MHEAARAVVDLAEEYEPSLIRLEELTNYREKIDDPMHDWPYNDLQEKIKAKAHEQGIGVVLDEPYYTSQTCRKCGHQDEQNREGLDFVCLQCGYEVNADVNAAMNLAVGN
jgi:IS605 OrfB family transposase